MALNNLRLQVLLQAIDRATSPLQRIQGGSTGAAKALRDARDRLKELNSQQKLVGDFRELRGGLDATSAKLTNAQAKVGRLVREMGQAGPPTKAMISDLTNAKRVAGELSEQHKRQAAQVQGLRDRLAAAGVSTRDLANHERQLRSDIAAATGSIEAQTAALRAQAAQQRRSAAASEALARSQRTQTRLAGAGVAMGATGAAIGAPVLGSVKDFASFEDHMLGVARQVQGARDQAGKLTPIYMAIRQQVHELGREIPLATNEIADMVVAGARMEVPTDQLKEYTRTAAMMATAFDAVPGEIAEQMGKVGKNFKIPVTQMEGLADSINYLDDNAISKGADIINVLNRISGVVSTVKMTAADAAALSSTLLTLGERPEAASTAINAITQKLAAATKGTKKFQSAVNEIGLNSAEIQTGMATDATATIQKVLAAIGKLPEKNRIGVMVELVGLEHSDTLAKLVDKPEEFQRQRELANGDQAKGSMRRESSARNDTMSAQWVMARNRAFELTTALGETLKPALIDLMNTVGRMASRVAGWVQANPALAAGIMKAAAALSALLVVTGSITLAMAALIGPFAMARYGMAMMGIKGFSMAAGLAKAGGALRLVGGLLLGLPGRLVSLVAALPAVVAGVQAAGSAFLALGTALLASPVGLVIAAIALAIGAAALAVIHYWEPIKGFFSGMWQGIGEGLAPLGALLRQVFDVVGTVLSPLKPVWDWFVGMLGDVAGWIGRLFTPMQATAQQLDGATQSGRAFGQVLGAIAMALLSPITLVAKLGLAVFDFVSRLWGDVRAAFAGGIASIGALILSWSPLGLFYQAFAGVMSWFGISLPLKFSEFGANILQGLVSGITSQLGAVKTAITSAADSAVGWFKDKLGIRSPSRVFMLAGTEISNGAAAGIAGHQDLVRKAALAMASAAAVSLPAAALPDQVKTPAQVAAGQAQRPQAADQVRQVLAPLQVAVELPKLPALAMQMQPPATALGQPALAPVLAAQERLPALAAPAQDLRPRPAPENAPTAVSAAPARPVDLAQILKAADAATRATSGTHAAAPASLLRAIDAIKLADLGSAPIDRRPPLSAQPKFQAAAPAPVADSAPITINIYPAKGDDPQAIARAVAAELDRRESAKRSARLSKLSDID